MLIEAVGLQRAAADSDSIHLRSIAFLPHLQCAHDGHCRMAGDREENLLYSNGVFEYQNRPRRDAGWTIAYIVFLALTVAFGLFGISNRQDSSFPIILASAGALYVPSLDPLATAEHSLLSVWSIAVCTVIQPLPLIIGIFKDFYSISQAYFS